jgi:uncharacterized protein
VTTYRLPMFPLGSVLFPFSVLPLRVFEDRYKALMLDVMAGSGEFGIVLIERGSEVGGGDVRFTVATVAKVLELHQLEDGGSLIAVVGTRRVEVLNWINDERYPMADVRDLDADLDEAGGGDVDSVALDSMISALRQVLAMRTELNEGGAPATIEFDESAVARVWQACAVLPVGPLDDLALLRCESSAQRIGLLQALIDDEALVLRNRLGSG